MNKLSNIRKHFLKNNDNCNYVLNVEKENPRSLSPLLNEDFADKVNIAVGSLENILCNPQAMSYFIQYMDNINHLNYIKFLIHTKSFSELSPPSYQEAMYIYELYFSAKSILSLFNESTTEKINKAISNKTITSFLYKDAVIRVKEVINRRYLNSFFSSVYYKSYLIECLNNSPFSLADVFNIDQLLCSFIEYLDTENDRKYLEFVIAVNSFLEDYNTSMDDKSQLEDAMLIYEKYISMEAIEALNFGDSVRVQVEQQICSLYGKPSKECFKVPYDLAKKLLQVKSIPQYRESLFFTRLKNDLKCTVDMINGVSNNTITNTINIECSSKKDAFQDDDSISLSSNTASSITNNSCSLTPRKKKIREYSLGKVDEYGRYSPLYDSTILNSQPAYVSNKIKQKIENLLSSNAKKESVVADQVAQLIINDIQNMINNGVSDA